MQNGNDNDSLYGDREPCTCAQTGQLDKDAVSGRAEGGKLNMKRAGIKIAARIRENGRVTVVKSNPEQHAGCHGAKHERARNTGFLFSGELRYTAVIAPRAGVAICDGLFNLTPGLRHDKVAAGTFDVRDSNFKLPGGS